MNRIDSLFARKGHNILSVFTTAGYPHIGSTADVIEALADRGIDMVEIGVPFSDPMADGVVIQHSSNVALGNGMTLVRLFEDVKEARRRVPDVPFVLMGYLNPMIRMGVENVFIKCREAGIDGIIIPDLPFSEYMRDYKSLCELYGIHLIMLITPETAPERIRLIDDNCSGFIYMVSTASTTGTKERFDSAATDYFKRIAEMDLHHNRLIGFGISNPATFSEACRYSSGAIIGSLFIKCLESASSPAEAVDLLCRKIGRV